jgi:hypothetical protein
MLKDMEALLIFRPNMSHSRTVENFDVGRINCSDLEQCQNPQIFIFT